MTRGARFVLVSLALAGMTCCSRRERPSDATRRGPVVVTIVIDAFAAWEADERLARLPEDGGFARLLREGTYVREMRYAHAALDTAPGHAALYTGAPPRTSGIFANERFDETTGVVVPMLRDPTARIVGLPGGTDLVAPSSAALRVDALADRLRASHPHATIVSLSMKDRGSILPGAHAANASVWFDEERDRFVTTSAIAGVLPAWAYESPGPAERATNAHTTWTPLDTAWLRANARVTDAQTGESDFEGLGRTFPHDLSVTRKRASAFRATPFADQALFDLALRAIDAPRDAREPFLLAVSLSANDYIGHVFGPESWESWDALRRLDTALARLFAALDARFGGDGWAMLVTGDHGATPMPETLVPRPPWCAVGMRDRWQRPCEPGERRTDVAGLGVPVDDQARQACFALARRSLLRGDRLNESDQRVFPVGAIRHRLSSNLHGHHAALPGPAGRNVVRSAVTLYPRDGFVEGHAHAAASPPPRTTAPTSASRSHSWPELGGSSLSIAAGHETSVDVGAPRQVPRERRDAGASAIGRMAHDRISRYGGADAQARSGT